MYRRPKFLEILLKIREEMAREADYDVDFFVEMVRNLMQPATVVRYALADREGEKTASSSRPRSWTKKK
jgi:hypothetical protein